MTEQSPIDTAHAAMQAAPEDGAARLRFYERVADGELYLLLSAEPDGDSISPEVFDIAQGRFVLAFDREERLSAFAGRSVPYAALPGRVLAGMLAGQGIGLGLNLDVAPSSFLVPSDAVDWLAQTVANAPDRVEAHVDEVYAPTGIPEHLLTALDAKLATTGGLAAMAYLAGVTYDNDAKGHMLAFIDAADAAQEALAKAVAEALTFSGIEAGALDVGFFEAASPIAASLARVGLRFDLPKPPDPEVQRMAPGTDPDKPPILK